MSPLESEKLCFMYRQGAQLPAQARSTRNSCQVTTRFVMRVEMDKLILATAERGAPVSAESSRSQNRSRSTRAAGRSWRQRATTAEICSRSTPSLLMRDG